MEYGWERTFPFLEIDAEKISKLFEGIAEEKDIINITPISEGCRTTNYMIQTRNQSDSKYILKIFPQEKHDCRKEINLLKKLEDNKILHVPRIYKFESDKIIEGREYVIYEYLEGKTIGRALKDGDILEEAFIREVARALAKIHSYKFNKAGFFDENLNIIGDIPPLKLMYENLMGERVKKRLGKSTVNKINQIVIQNEKILLKLDEDIRLVHGDFQGTNILIKNNRLAGILDWELSMAGHPLSDIGQFFRYDKYFNNNMIEVFNDEYNKNSTYKLVKNWYKISKLIDLKNLIQLVDTIEYMPNKHGNINIIIGNTLDLF